MINTIICNCIGIIAGAMTGIVISFVKWRWKL